MTLTVVLLVALGAASGVAHAQDPGYALRFDGVSDFVRLAPTAWMMAPGWETTKTVSLWVKPTGTSFCNALTPPSCDVIFGDRPRWWGISRGMIDGVDRIWVWNWDGTLDAVAIDFTPGEWLHIALVHGDGMLAAYRNGVLVGSVASGATQQPNTGALPVLHLGGIINNTTRNWTFDGELDEVQIWNTVRTAAEIGQDMMAPLLGTEYGLAAYYRMTDGAGVWLTDDSGHGWTGSLQDGGGILPPDGPILWMPSGAFGAVPEPEPANTPPSADSQNVNTIEDGAVPIVLTGTDPDGDALTFSLVTLPVFGFLSGTGSSLVYTPSANFNGEDSFTFIVSDGSANSAAATVTVTVAPINDPPVAANDAAPTAVDTSVSVSVLANDVDVDGDALAIVAVAQPANGVALHDGTRITFLPDPGFSGTNRFSYTISDGQGGTSSAYVTLTVTGAGGDPGYALRFDGVSDFVRLAPTAWMMAPGWETTKTVSLWVKPTGTSFCNAPSPPSCDVIFGDRPRWWGISRGMVDGVDRIWVWNWDGTLDAVAIDFTPGEWLHIALVHGDGMLAAYRNGVLVGSVASGATQQPDTGALPVLHLGGIINNTTRNWTFEGELDEVQIWNTARTAAEIGQDMMTPLLGTEYGLAAYYRMTDGAGVWLTDDSGRGWTGSLQDGGNILPPDGPILWVPSGAFIIRVP